MRSVLSIVIAFLIVSAVPARVLPSDISGSALLEAQRVMRLIERIERTPAGAGSPFRKAVVSESELNSYIAYRIETEKEQMLKEFQLKLLDDNEFEGRMLIDLRGQKIPAILQPRMNFYFSGKLRVEEDKVKVDIDRLFMEKQRIHPLLLDLLIYISAKLDNVEATSLKDWYQLPYGIKNLEIAKGLLTALY